MENKNCKCLGCEKTRIMNETIQEMISDKDNAIYYYVHGIHNIFVKCDEMKGDRCVNSENTQTTKLSNVLVSLYPKHQLLEHSICKKMKNVLDQLGSEYLTFQTIFRCYLAPFFEPTVTEEILIDVSLRYDDANMQTNDDKFFQGLRRALQRYSQMWDEIQDLEKENNELRLLVAHYQNMPGGDQYQNTKEHFDKLIKK